LIADRAEQTSDSLHFVIVGASLSLVQDLWNRIAMRGGFRMSYIVHPSHDLSALPGGSIGGARVFFMREDVRDPLPVPDRELLASLERDGVPTIHNMIMSDRFVSAVPYDEALAYATALVRRLIALYDRTKPSVIIGGFDALHGSLAFAVAKRMGIPWFALYFGTRPSGQAAFCADLSPASLVAFDSRSRGELQTCAENLLAQFEQGSGAAAYYIPPRVLSMSFALKRIPAQLRTLRQVLKRRRLRRYAKFSDPRTAYSLAELFREAIRLRRNVWELRRHRLRDKPIDGRFAFFGLHMQPESSIDVFAHFFSNQTRVIELMARSLPPTHRLLVKLHKSDDLNYSTRRLRELSAFPGVELVSADANSREFIERTDLVFAIQGTIGLEAALLGKPVIMFGDSPTKVFPSVATIGKTIDLPGLVREKLKEQKPRRAQIVAALACYLAPFHAASGNDWSSRPTDEQIDGYVRLFELLQEHVHNTAHAAVAGANQRRDQ
jgi:hypothetical protein